MDKDKEVLNGSPSQQINQNIAVSNQPLSETMNNNRNAQSSCENNDKSSARLDPDNGECLTISDPPAGTGGFHSKQHSFGWGKFQPKFLQGFCTPKWALFWFCWGGALQGLIVNGFINGVITSIEKRFGLRSAQTGLVASGYDIASFFCLIPVSYFGGRKGTSKPRYLAWGIVVMGIGSLVFSLPHFLIGPYKASFYNEDVCTSANDVDDGLLLLKNSTISEHTIFDGIKSDLTWAVWFFLCGQLLIGAGASPLYTLGVAYIDENVSKKMSSVYLGIYYTMAIIGPAAGYVVGGQLLLIYTDFLTVDASEIGLTTDSNVWIGAWWIGFLIGALLCFLLAIPMFGFPETLPGTEKLQEDKNSESHNAVQGKSYTTLKEMPRAFWTLLQNPAFIFLNMAAASEGLVIAGFSVFLPKQIENQYSLSATFAAVLVGSVTVPAGGGGTFLGGYLIKKFKLKCLGIIKMCVLTTLMATILSSTFLLTCPNVSFAGVTVNYPKTSNNDVTQNLIPFPLEISLETDCNANCSCSSVNYDPICGVDNIMYYNPCFAGCQDMVTSNKKKIYGNCSCIAKNEENWFAHLESNQAEATNTMCPSTCHHLPYFVALLFVLLIFTFLCTMPALSATLRCVNDDQRSFALGIQWMKVRVFGTIPAPIIFGALIDRTCILWQDTYGNDSSGACLLFNNYEMSKYMIILALAGKAFSLVFFIGAWWFYKPPKTIDDNNIKEADTCT